jgi:hypothetical protein
MYANPAEELRALTENYRAMSDGQLLELAEDFASLRPAAQQALRDELKLRKLGDPQSPDWGQRSPEQIAPSGIEEHEPGIEFTWKTPLCDCESREEAWQIGEVLRRAKIESWLEGQRDAASSGLRILVAADQLEDAQRVIANPIPADVIEESHLTPPEYDLPVCPKCGTADPILVGVDPVNVWECESCGAEWEDSVQN